jgi:hypothetical protein
MIELDEARVIADNLVAELNKEGRFGVELAVRHISVRDVGIGWLFYFNTLKYIQTDDDEDALLGGNTPFIVAKEDGSLHFFGESGEFGLIIKAEVNKYRF